MRRRQEKSKEGRGGGRGASSSTLNWSQFEPDLSTNWFVSKKKIFSKWTFFPEHEPVRDQKQGVALQKNNQVTFLERNRKTLSEAN